MIRRKLRNNFRAYFHATRPTRNYLYGRHTEGIIDACQRAVDSLEKGKSFYCIINVPFRHGKSDICSRRFPAWYLTKRPDDEIILASYNYSLSAYHAYEARKTFRQTGPVFGMDVQADRSEVGSWKVSDHRGAMHSAGLGGTIVGKGANTLVVDDYYKNREEAESEAVRERVWDSFRSDLMTRLAPVHAVLIVANRWHVDDLVGKILNANNKNHKDYDEDFPVFEVLKYPAQSAEGKWLFSERFSDSWYQSIKSLIGKYGWASLAQQEPGERIGKLLRADLVTFVDKFVDANGNPLPLQFSRGWDIASTEKELAKDDPDWTVGTKAAFYDGCLYIDDVRRGQWSALKRDGEIKKAALEDGPEVVVRVETVGGYVDTYHNLRAALSGLAVVRRVNNTTDKVVNAGVLEPVFEAGKVFVRKAPWNYEWQTEFINFPGGKKDDQVDSLVVTVKEEIKSFGTKMLSS